ncbi:MAG TPA: hypothetical protein VKT83_00105 [bacterium]|nr:hypothetical protein [bacterium]
MTSPVSWSMSKPSVKKGLLGSEDVCTWRRLGEAGRVMGWFGHPGFMQYEFGLEVLHADWPVYPAGRGWETALGTLGVFPSDWRFFHIDEIDQCTLFVCARYGTKFPKAPFDLDFFHVAVWDEDLLELHCRGLVAGLSVLTAYQAAFAYYEKVKDMITSSGARLFPLNQPGPRPDEYDEYPQEVRVAEAGLAVTDAGMDMLSSLARPIDSLDEQIRNRVKPILLIPFYDTVVREASVILETRLRDIVHSASYGQNLVKEYYELVCKQDGGSSAFLKVLRGELRTIFKFVRNDFAHSLKEITESQCSALLDRISRALESVNQIHPTRS